MPCCLADTHTHTDTLSPDALSHLIKEGGARRGEGWSLMGRGRAGKRKSERETERASAKVIRY